MESATVGTRGPSAGVARPALAVAAIASVFAGVVHVAAAVNHEGDVLLTWMFVACAAAQLSWGTVALLRPRPRLLLVGLAINGGALAVWALTRTVGIAFIDALSEVETVGQQDLGAALFAGVSVFGAVLVLVRPVASPGLTIRWVGVMASVALVAALPALSADHTHESSDGHTHLAAATEHGAHDPAGGEHAGGEHAAGEHAAGDGEDHAAGEHAAGDGEDHAAGDHAAEDGGDHGDGHPADDPAHDEHPADDPAHDDHPDDPDDPPHDDHPDDPDDPPHDDHPGDPTGPSGPIISIDDPRLSDEEFAAAVALIVSTTSGMRGFVTEADVVAAGYESIGDGGEPGEYEHFVNWSYLIDGFELDPAHIESIVMKMNADGTTRVVSAMYILTVGDTMADVPPIAGELTTWHDHDNLCFEGTQLVAIAVDGVCPVGVLINTPPMLHVWVEANPCGPFAAIGEHGVECGEVPHPH